MSSELMEGPGRTTKVSARRLLERLHLESDVRSCAGQLLCFIGYVIAFFFTWHFVSPPGEVFFVHQRLERVFGLPSAREVRSVDDMYSFILNMANSHKQLEVTAADQWCESRFYSIGWDAMTATPQSSCAQTGFRPLAGSSLDPALRSTSSSRLLGAGNNSSLKEASNASAAAPAKPFSSLNFRVTNVAYDLISLNTVVRAAFERTVIQSIIGFMPSGITEKEFLVLLSQGSLVVDVNIYPALGVTMDDLDSALRQALPKLPPAIAAGIRSVPGIDEVSTGVSQVESLVLRSNGPTCFDSNEALAVRLNRTANCSTLVPDICGLDIGLTLCPQSCNLCGPFRYRRMRKFAGPMMTLLPPVVYQSRFEEAPCSGFAAQYEAQSYNPNLIFYPPLDGTRSGKLITCADRGRAWERPYAKVVPCPVSINCPNGSRFDTPKVGSRVDGTVAYAKLFLSPQIDVERMQAIEWVDAGTGTVSISMLVYTQGLEIFTALTATFEIDPVGGITSQVRMHSWKELTGEEEKSLIAAAAVCALLVAIGVLFNILRWRSTSLTLALAFELFARLWLLTLVLALMGWYLDAPKSSSQFEAALTTLNENDDLSVESKAANVIDAFFRARRNLGDRLYEADNFNLVCCLAMSFQLILLAIYFSAHPKTGLLPLVLWRASERLAYLVVLFAPIFFFVACMVYWVLGSKLTVFSTYGETLVTQTRMLYGDYLQVPGADRLDSADMVMYWIHAITFMLCVFFLLRFVFLAVVVDAYMDVKGRSTVTASSAPFDILDSFFAKFFFWKRRWGSQDKLIKWLEEKKPGAVLSVDNLKSAFAGNDASDRAASLLEYYAKKVPTTLASNDEGCELRKAARAEAAPPELPVPNVPAKAKRELNPQHLAHKVMAEISARFSEKPVEELDRFVVVGKLSSIISQEFRACGLIKS